MTCGGAEASPERGVGRRPHDGAELIDSEFLPRRLVYTFAAGWLDDHGARQRAAALDRGGNARSQWRRIPSPHAATVRLDTPHVTLSDIEENMG
jgi:hypothetical protein